MPFRDTDPDVQLMLRFQQGDEDGFLKLFSKYQTRIIHFCFRFCGDRTLAEDLAQDVFLRVYRGAASVSAASKVCHLALPHCSECVPE